jgi:hypothetical protein
VAVLKAIKAFNHKRIRDLLSNYMNETLRYYNVIHWLDFGVNVPRNRAAPAASREMARMVDI